MPKKRVNKTKAGLTSKFRIGNAKGGVGGHSLSTEQLKEVLTNENKKRWHNNAIKVLQSRGITLDFQLSS